MKPSAARRMAGRITACSGRVPCFASMCVQPARLPGTATADAPTALRRSLVSRADAAPSLTGSYMSARAAFGAQLRLSIMIWRPSGRRMCDTPPPRMPTIIGSTTVSANSAATAASTALPPPSRISAAAAEASGWFVTAMPREPTAGRFSQTKGVARDRESGTGDMDAVLQSAIMRLRRDCRWSQSQKGA